MENGKKITIDFFNFNEQNFKFIEAQKLFNIDHKKLDIIIHPESLVHAIIKFKNGMTKFIYHETSMIVPLTNAIFGDNFNIKIFLNKKKQNEKLENLTFVKPKFKNISCFKIKRYV